ncbi:MAG: hypothetical protein KKH53_02625 [Gammaproteobacteria bacterium]|nr:hypothetical protein [Gammaproteobacteria bacterium]
MTDTCFICLQDKPCACDAPPMENTVPALFRFGWDAGFQEALTPDDHPDQDRCLDAYLQMVGSGMIQK